ncbi:MAG: 2-polyprenyl-3-methyl-5-hydroxy-6-metoxy-1,4-benzoquinol methylase [Colwellia sp.]|jgi:2-polyprenyl-3-methyl-5-hydroxy-6-metoxy-1,4-benzoquinol methylase
MSSNSRYYANVRSGLLDHVIKKDGSAILELGCAEGKTGKWLKENGHAAYYVGLDIHEPSIKIASHDLDEAICTDLDTFMFSSLGEKRFDFILCGDVLEHLRDPWAVLSDLSHVIKEDGTLVITVPNTQHYTVSLALLFKGEWSYKDAGILDRTHIRFFTRKTMFELYNSKQYSLVANQALFWGRRDPFINKITLGIFENILAPQWNLVLKRKSGTVNDYGV